MFQNLCEIFGSLIYPGIKCVKIEAHSKRTEPEYQGNALANFHARTEEQNL